MTSALKQCNENELDGKDEPRECKHCWSALASIPTSDDIVGEEDKVRNAMQHRTWLKGNWQQFAFCREGKDAQRETQMTENCVAAFDKMKKGGKDRNGNLWNDEEKNKDAAEVALGQWDDVEVKEADMICIPEMAGLFNAVGLDPKKKQNGDIEDIAKALKYCSEWEATNLEMWKTCKSCYDKMATGFMSYRHQQVKFRFDQAKWRYQAASTGHDKYGLLFCSDEKTNKACVEATWYQAQSNPGRWKPGATNNAYWKHPYWQDHPLTDTAEGPKKETDTFCRPWYSGLL